MSRSAYEEELKRFRQSERPEAVLLLANDKEYINMVVAWTSTSVKRKRRVGKRRTASQADTWEWLWENVQFSREELMSKSQVPPKRFEPKLNALIANRVLYPDGSVNSFVRRFLTQKVLKLVGAKPKAIRGT